MSDVIESARKLIQARLQELEKEAESLKKALRNLGGNAATKRSSRPPRKRPGRPRASKRAPRGQRRQQFLDALKKTPGAKASEIATEVGVSSNQAYALARQLLKDGAIRKSGKGYRLKK